MSRTVRAVYGHAWMQKHPTPTKSGGDFHWHPSGIPDAIRVTLSELAARGRGHTSSAWIIDRSYVAWARAFAAVSPSDRRKYTGLAVTIARLDPESAPGASEPSDARFAAALPALLADMPLPPAVPFVVDQAVTHQRALSLEVSDGRPQAVNPDELSRLVGEHVEELARALFRGGQVSSREAHAETLPRVFAQLLSWLPERERTSPRTGMFIDHHALERPPIEDRSLDNLTHYLAAAWLCPVAIAETRPEYARDVWRLVCELAAGRSQSLLEVFADLTRVASAWDSAGDLLAYMLERGVLTRAELASCDRRAPSPLSGPRVSDAGRLWNRVLHYWGRGFLAYETAPRLAALLAQRIAVDHLFHLDAPDERSLPHRYLRRLRYEALLSRERKATLSTEVARHLPSIPRAPEVQCGG